MHATPPLGRRYFPHIADICAGVAAVAARYTTLSPLLMLVWLRLRRTLTRLDRLAARWQQGRLTPRPAGTHSRQPPQPADASHPGRTPQGHAWLIRLHQPLAQFAPRIQLLLDDPEVSPSAPPPRRPAACCARSAGCSPSRRRPASPGPPASGRASPGRRNPSRRPSPSIRPPSGRSSRTACACVSPASAARNRPTERGRGE